VRDALPALDAAAVREEQRQWDPSWMPAYALAETVAHDYPAFLRGRMTGEDVLFAPRRLRLWVDYFSNDNGLYAVNNRVGAVAAAEWLPAGDTVVLELGAGLASGAVALLDEIEARGRLGDVRGYRFTEPVSAFLRRGGETLRARYPTLPGVTAEALDMNRPFAEQGVPPASVDLVYAVNTLHVAFDLAFTLGEVRRSLCPGGRLVIAECVPPPDPIYTDFVFNLAETFRAPRLHPAYRPHGGFLGSAHWSAAMAAAGLEDVRVLPDVARIRAEVPDWSVAAIGATRPADG
jgi:SAM-dependent methyltransferase